jgi:hypothetical protein
MPRHGAIERVSTRRQLSADRSFAFGDQFGARDLLAVRFDRNVVFQRRRVSEVDRDFARLAADTGLVIGEVADVGRERDRAAGTRSRPGFGLCAALTAARLFLPRLRRFFFSLFLGLCSNSAAFSCSSSLACRTENVAAPPIRTTNQRTTNGKALPGKLLTFRPTKLISTAEIASAIPHM